MTNSLRKSINSNEWLIIHEPLSREKCIYLIENRFIRKRLSKSEVIEHILSMLMGFESESFIWNNDEKKFETTNDCSMINVNHKSYQRMLMKFTPIGTMYRRMQMFVETEYFRGKTFYAYQNVLKKILEEIMDNILKVKQYFIDNSSDIKSDKNLRIILIESFIDSEQNNQIILSIRNLYAIHQDIMNDSNNDRDEMMNSNDSLFKMETALHRHYCRQTLDAIHKRLSIPNIRIRSLAYTMLDHSFRILFISLETMLNSLNSLSEISSNEFLFESKFRFKSQLLNAECKVNEMSKFWHDFLFVDKRFKSLSLFQFESLELLADAIKCAFVCRINEIQLKSMNQLKNIKIISLFRSIMSKMLDKNCPKSSNKLYEIHCDSCEIIEKNHLIEYHVQRFRIFQIPVNTVLNIILILNEALNETFETISRPIIREFLPELRHRYLRLFNYYTNFFLCQNVQHTLLYTHFLYPVLKDYLLQARQKGSFLELDLLMKQIHRAYLQQNDSDYDGLNFFQPYISLTIQTDKFKTNFYDNHNDFDWIIQSFEIFYYVPSSVIANEYFDRYNTSMNKQNDSKKIIDKFWPLTIMFNSKINDLFNEMFQFLLRLRYFQYLIGNDFLLSSKFRHNDLRKNIYLFRFRLANIIYQFGHQMEYRLNELIKQTMNSFENEINNVEEFFCAHQKFLEKLEQIKSRVIESDFIRNQFRIIAKFCHTNSSDNQKLTNSFVKNRRQSIVDYINNLDHIKSDDFNI